MWRRPGAPKAGDGAWDGWLPHLDLAVARAFTAGSAEHDRLWELLKQPGTLTLRTKLDLWQMLRPAVQPGSTLDYTLPDEKVTFLMTTDDRDLQVTAPPGVSVSYPIGGVGMSLSMHAELKLQPKRGEPIPLEVRLETGKTRICKSPIGPTRTTGRGRCR